MFIAALALLRLSTASVTIGLLVSPCFCYRLQLLLVVRVRLKLGVILASGMKLAEDNSIRLSLLNIRSLTPLPLAKQVTSLWSCRF